MSWEDEYDQFWSDRYEKCRARDEACRSAGIEPPPPHLETDLDVLEEIGGPCDIAGFLNASEIDLGLACSRFPERNILPVLMKYGDDLTSARRHWPWVAEVLSVYASTAQFCPPERDLKPTEVENLLGSIRQCAVGLEQALNELGEACLWHREPQDIWKGGHLQYLQQLLANGVSLSPTDFVDTEDITGNWSNFMHYRYWRSELSGLIESVKSAQNLMSRDLLTSRNRSQNPGVETLIGRLGAIWTNYTGKKPSASRTHGRESEDAPFVRFVGDAVNLCDATVHRPTSSNIHTALGRVNNR